MAAGLARRGAAVVDADAVGREILEPDGAAYQAVVDHFGPGSSSRTDRSTGPPWPEWSFGDPGAQQTQPAHPPGDRPRSWLSELSPRCDAPGVVVLDVALLSIVTTERFQLDAIVVVDTPEDVAVARLVEHRGFSQDDAWSRVAAQIDRDERRQVADMVARQQRRAAALETEMDRVWAWLRERAGQV